MTKAQLNKPRMGYEFWYLISDARDQQRSPMTPMSSPMEVRSSVKALFSGHTIVSVDDNCSQQRPPPTS
ncbi:hypothetical protein L2E82_39793 [Cichorium intybus]|uniref:Uncharacterized protein n=1 Tax=Cichorium intybus TaxID=13427 RepID=A0ACB9ANL7_CICIN|nr:hypothetical protein L2E82_39793 [Cichorium intybus]